MSNLPEIEIIKPDRPWPTVEEATEILRERLKAKGQELGFFNSGLQAQMISDLMDELCLERELPLIRPSMAEEWEAAKALVG